MRSSLEKERVLVLSSMLLIAILAAVVPFALRIPALAKSFVAEAQSGDDPLVSALIAGGESKV